MRPLGCIKQVSGDYRHADRAWRYVVRGRHNPIGKEEQLSQLAGPARRFSDGVDVILKSDAGSRRR